MEYRRDPFQAIADPTRREIIMLIARKTLHLNAIADHFEISRPAISKHIRILHECGMITIKQKGRERFCTAKIQKLKEVWDWTEQYSDLWDKKLNALQEFLAKEKTSKKKSSF
jgi:DNA-binding transcriptional ArsR family regulator